MILLALIVAIVAALYGCGGGSSSGEKVAPVADAPDAPVWTEVGETGVCCHYTPIVFDGHLRVYSNTGPSGDGVWHLDGREVLRISDPRDRYIRTSAVARDHRGYVALLYSGDGYPTQGGYSPSWATSPDGQVWTWHGSVSVYGRFQSSAAALVIEADGSFTAWSDNTGVKLRRSTSHDGIHWTADKADAWPVELSGDSPQFPSAARTPYGYHMIAADQWPAQRHRHLFSCDGEKWRVLEMDAPTINQKGANLTYSDGTLYAVAAGRIWTTPARGWTC